jgi:hypothetical protein
LAAAAVVVDLVRFNLLDGAHAVGFANILFVWATVYQAGIAYASGTLTWARGRRAVAVAAGGLAMAALAVALGPYPGSMIGMPGEPVSNMSPPTAVLLAISALQLGVALSLRPGIERWASRGPVAAGLGWLSARLMTIYVWHMPALIVVAGIAVVGFGWATPPLLSAEWRAAMPLWLACLAAVLTGLVRLFGRFEHPMAGAPLPTAWRVRLATVLIGLGLLSLTTSGFSPGLVLQPHGPAAAGLAVALGTAALRSPRAGLGRRGVGVPRVTRPAGRTMVGLAPPEIVQLTGSLRRPEREKVGT